MSLPFGDHTGFDDTESTSRTGAPPARGTLYSRTMAPSLTPIAIHRPSGDQDGAPRTSRDGATVRALVPSDAIHRSVDRPFRRMTKQSSCPSGEMPTAPATAPSLGFQSSTAFDPVRRHTPSAPLRDARYRSEPSGANLGAADREVGTASRAAESSPTMPDVMGTHQS